MRMIPVKRLLTPAVAGLCLLGAVSLFAHYTWLAPAPSAVKAGETVTVLLASGHAFPAAEQPLKGVDVKAKVADPAGRTMVLAVADKGRGPEATFKTGPEGLYRVAGEYDRGVISRTPEGWKPGGRAAHPDASSVIRSYSSFLCAVRTTGTAPGSAAPLGLAFEISWSRTAGGVTVLVTAGGKPVEGADVSIILGSGEAKPAGKTGSAGRVEIEIAKPFKGPVLLTGSISKPAPAGSDYDAERLSSSYFLTWD